jgi:hypothetical protein
MHDTERSKAGVATLSSVHRLLSEHQNLGCFVMYDAIGLIVDGHYARTMCIAPTRRSFAASLLAHHPPPQTSILTTANKYSVAKADLFYSCGPSNIGLTVINTQPAPTARLGPIYRQINDSIFSPLSSSWAPLLGMLHLMTWRMDGFGPSVPLCRK